MHDGFVNQAKKKGAPIVFAEGVEPVISPSLQVGLLKGARHPNAGYLFAAFLVTPEAQEIWEKYTAQHAAAEEETTGAGACFSAACAFFTGAGAAGFSVIEASTKGDSFLVPAAQESAFLAQSSA